jgi:hypothetical protein
MNTLHRESIENQVAIKVSAKVKEEFDTTTGQTKEEILQQVAQNGGMRKTELGEE